MWFRLANFRYHRSSSKLQLKEEFHEKKNKEEATAVVEFFGRGCINFDSLIVDLSEALTSRFAEIEPIPSVQQAKSYRFNIIKVITEAFAVYGTTLNKANDSFTVKEEDLLKIVEFIPNDCLFVEETTKNDSTFEGMTKDIAGSIVDKLDENSLNKGQRKKIKNNISQILQNSKLIRAINSIEKESHFIKEVTKYLYSEKVASCEDDELIEHLTTAVATGYCASIMPELDGKEALSSNIKELQSALHAKYQEDKKTDQLMDKSIASGHDDLASITKTLDADEDDSANHKFSKWMLFESKNKQYGKSLVKNLIASLMEDNADADKENYPQKIDFSGKFEAVFSMHFNDITAFLSESDIFLRGKNPAVKYLMARAIRSCCFTLEDKKEAERREEDPKTIDEYIHDNKADGKLLFIIDGYDQKLVENPKNVLLREFVKELTFHENVLITSKPIISKNSLKSVEIGPNIVIPKERIIVSTAQKAPSKLPNIVIPNKRTVRGATDKEVAKKRTRSMLISSAAKPHTENRRSMPEISPISAPCTPRTPKSPYDSGNQRSPRGHDNGSKATSPRPLQPLNSNKKRSR